MSLEQTFPPPAETDFAHELPEIQVLHGTRAQIRRPYSSTLSVLSLRQSEILTLLAVRPGGYTTAQLAVALSERELAPGAIRVEMSRLRNLFPELGIESRPYRITQPIQCDVSVVLGLLQAHEYDTAQVMLRDMQLLPDSQSPALSELRAELLATAQEW